MGRAGGEHEQLAQAFFPCPRLHVFEQRLAAAAAAVVAVHGHAGDRRLPEGVERGAADDAACVLSTVKRSISS